MTCSIFRDTGRCIYFRSTPRGKSSNRTRLRHCNRLRLWLWLCELPGGVLLIHMQFPANHFRDTTADHAKCRYKHPEPPDSACGCIVPCTERNQDKRHTHNKTLDALVDAWFFAIAVFSISLIG